MVHVRRVSQAAPRSRPTLTCPWASIAAENPPFLPQGDTVHALRTRIAGLGCLVFALSAVTLPASSTRSRPGLAGLLHAHGGVRAERNLLSIAALCSGSLRLRSNCWKRTSVRKGSRQGSTFTEAIQSERSSRALSPASEGTRARESRSQACERDTAQGVGIFRSGGARPPSEVMVSFVDEHRDVFGVEPICAQLPIATATYYTHRARRLDPSRRPARQRRDEGLSADIRGSGKRTSRSTGSGRSGDS